VAVDAHNSVRVLDKQALSGDGSSERVDPAVETTRFAGEEGLAGRR
jgi:hypothetical protein